jgi:diguanylate cyclase (GGDEF)-like protein/PAS domain S-box-containing protein
MTEQKQPLHVIGGTTHATEAELLRLQAEIERRNVQQTAIAELGQAALTGVDPHILLGQACALIEMTLGVEHCRALEITAAGRVELRASIGSNATFTDCQHDDEENESIAMYVSVAGGPVTFGSLDQETRFKSSHLRDYHGVRNGAGVVIPTASGVFGALLVYSSTPRTFADYEIAFLKSAANLLGEAVERARDISERKRAHVELEQSEERFRALVEKSWSGVALLDENLAFTYVGSSTQGLLGYSDEELMRTSFIALIHPRDRQATLEVFADLLAATPTLEARAEFRFLHKNGTWIWLEGFAQNLLPDPSVRALVVNYRDITQRKATEKQLEYQAYYDALTGLPNRLLFRDRVVNAIAQARRHRRGIAVMYLDLDHFKLVNDGLGHSVGDALLSDVAVRLQGSIRASDTISRLGGDEFTILLNDTTSSDSVFSVARKVLQSLARPFRVEGHELYVTASIGISVFPADGEDVEKLLKCADSAMYRAKELGRNQAQLFTSSMNERYVQRLELEQSLHHAVEREELEVYYQPIFESTRQRVVALEALLRWNHPTRGLIEPVDFIQLAEETGLIVAMGEWAIRRACSQLREWHEAGFPELRMSVNISAPQLQQVNFIDFLAEAMAQCNLHAALLDLEITESIAVQNVESTMQILREVKRHGVGIAIDDFGTGQSSLIYLKRFPIDTVKIDQAFVSDVTSDESTAAIVSYIINLAHTLHLNVVAEGVETEEQYQFLLANGCDRMQGFLFSRPLPAQDAYEFLKANRKG